jgi:hypothetical protein
MKSYNEMAQNALDKINEQKKIRAKRNKIIIGTIAPALCLALVIAIGAFGGTPKKDITEPTSSSEIVPGGIITGHYWVPSGEYDGTYWGNSEFPSGTASEVSSSVTESAIGFEDEIEDIMLVVYNRISGVQTASKRHYDMNEHYIESWGNSDICKYFGTDFDITKQYKYYSFNRPEVTKAIFKNDKTVVFDTCHFSYSRGGKIFNVSVGKVTPPYDCMYLTEDKFEYNNVFGKGVDVKFYTEGYQNDNGLCVSDFEMNGCTYRIESENASRREFQCFVFDFIHALAK